MKYILPLLLIIALSFGNYSCQKEFTLDPIDSTLITFPVKGSFIANIDGVKYMADQAASASIASGKITLTGISRAGESISIAVKDTGIYVYTLGGPNTPNVGVYSKNNEIAYSTEEGSYPEQSGGTLSVTAIDRNKRTISGTFSMKVFRGVDNKTKNITEGVFTEITF